MGFAVTSALSGEFWGCLYPAWVDFGATSILLRRGLGGFWGYLYPTKEGMGGFSGLPLGTGHGAEALGALELVGEVNAATELTLQLGGIPLLFGFWGAWRDTQREKPASSAGGLLGKSREAPRGQDGLGAWALPCRYGSSMSESVVVVLSCGGSLSGSSSCAYCLCRAPTSSEERPTCATHLAAPVPQHHRNSFLWPWGWQGPSQPPHIQA